MTHAGEALVTGTPCFASNIWQRVSILLQKLMMMKHWIRCGQNLEVRVV